MKSLFTFFLVFFLTFTGCTLKEKPVFLSIEKINIKKASSNEIDFNTSAVFNNPNSVGGEIINDTISIFIDGIQVGTINPNAFKVPSKNEFSIPLEGSLSTTKILERKQEDLINNILSIVTSQKIKVTFKGDLKFKKGFLKHTYHVNETKEVRIKL